MDFIALPGPGTGKLASFKKGQTWWPFAHFNASIPSSTLILIIAYTDESV